MHKKDRLERARTTAVLFAAILVTSFAGKIGVRLLEMEREPYWESGYSHYYVIAQSILDYGTFCWGNPTIPGDAYFAKRAPIYPLFIAGICWASNYSAKVFVICEALVSSVAVALVFVITRRLAPSGVALLSAALYAFYPYSFIHDTQLQENVLLNLSTLCLVYALLVALDGKRTPLFFYAGLLAGFCVLTRTSHMAASLASFCAIISILGRQPLRACKFGAAFLLGLSLLVVPWMIRNKLWTGKLVLSSEPGVALSMAHNDYLFRYFPYKDSIDVSFRVYRENMSEDEKRQRAELQPNEIGLEHWFADKAYDYMTSHIVQTITEGFCKAAVNFAGILSPLASPLKNWVYAISYWIITLPGFYGLYRLRGTAYFQIVLWIVLAQLAVSFVFWAHTSHRSYLDPLFAIPAGVGLVALFQNRILRIAACAR